MQTVAVAIGQRIEDLRELLREFLLEHSGSLRDINERDSVLIFVGPTTPGAILTKMDGVCNHGCSTTTGAWRRLSARF